MRLSKRCSIAQCYNTRLFPGTVRRLIHTPRSLAHYLSTLTLSILFNLFPFPKELTTFDAPHALTPVPCIPNPFFYCLHSDPRSQTHQYTSPMTSGISFHNHNLHYPRRPKFIHQTVFSTFFPMTTVSQPIPTPLALSSQSMLPYGLSLLPSAQTFLSLFAVDRRRREVRVLIICFPRFVPWSCHPLNPLPPTEPPIQYRRCLSSTAHIYRSAPHFHIPTIRHALYWVTILFPKYTSSSYSSASEPSPLYLRVHILPTCHSLTSSLISFDVLILPS